MNLSDDTETMPRSSVDAKLPELLSAAEVEKYFGKS
jgi:hypothetical protein